MHLKTIEPSLIRIHQMAMSSPEPDEEHGEVDEIDDNLKAPSVDVEGTSAPLPLWKSYLDWVSLMVVHFEQ